MWMVAPAFLPGALVGRSYGLIVGSHSTGRVSAGATGSGSTTSMGGLAGANEANSTIRASWSTAAVHSDEGAGNRRDHNYAGGLVGANSGHIAACFATGRVEGHGVGGFYGGGLVGLQLGSATITASYATGTVTTSQPRTYDSGVGGLVGRMRPGARITASYAVGSVPATTNRAEKGGLIGERVGGVYLRYSYYDAQTTGHTSIETGARGVPKTTAEMKGPTRYAGSLYWNWNVNVDGVAGNDDPWDFGSYVDYPVLKFGGLDKVPQRDYDRDDDNLIDIYSLRELNAIRYDLDGNGAVDDATDAEAAAAHHTAYAAPYAGLGCPDACAGYELGGGLNLDTNGNGRADRLDQYWDNGQGWQPIGSVAAPWAAPLVGNGHGIYNLHIDRSDAAQVGLFGVIGSGGSVTGVGLPGANVTGARTAGTDVGSLAGRNAGSIAAAYAAGSVRPGAPTTAWAASRGGTRAALRRPIPAPRLRAAVRGTPAG